MLNAKSFLAADFGAGTLKLAEFETNEAGGLRLVQYGVKALGAEGSQESAREGAIIRALQDIFANKAFQSKVLNACAPGYHVFSKFVKLPQVDTSKVQQIIQYEAQQNVPFPLAEVVWDYQILGTSATGELEVLLVAIKTEVVEGMFKVAESSGLRMQLVDVSPAALCNAFRYNYADLEGEGCTMLLDIGAKTSNLLFFEKGKVYARSINIGANSITQDFATEAKVKFPEAEAIKIEKGMVSLGGAYEEPEDPQAAAISKIARQVMTRLHIQVNQTIQFYRGQQGGSAPVRLYLSGGASIMTYTGEFFAEKLGVPVEYFNPFRNVQIDPSINVEELAPVAHIFGEVVGLGLRNLAVCPVELNLMPESSIQRQEFQQKKPYFIGAAFCLAAVVFAVAFFEQRVVAIKQDALESLKAKVQPMLQKESQMNEAQSQVQELKKETEKVTGMIDDRFFWVTVLGEFRRLLMDTEEKGKQRIGADAGIWIDSFHPQVPVDMSAGTMAVPTRSFAPTPEVMDRYGGGKGGGVPEPMVPNPSPEQQANPSAANEISLINIVLRGVDLEKISPTANNDLIFILKDEIKASPLFVESATVVDSIKKEEGGQNPSLTFTVNLTVQLKRPLKFKYPAE